MCKISEDHFGNDTAIAFMLASGDSQGMITVIQCEQQNFSSTVVCRIHAHSHVNVVEISDVQVIDSAHVTGSCLVSCGKHRSGVCEIAFSDFVNGICFRRISLFESNVVLEQLTVLHHVSPEGELTNTMALLGYNKKEGGFLSYFMSLDDVERQVST